MASVNDIRNSSVVTKTTVVIDSKFRTSGDINNLVFDLGTTIENVQLVDIRNITFINILNNVNESNNKLNWVDNSGVTHLNEITAGNYNSQTMIDEISNVLTTNSTDGNFYTGEFSFTTNKMTITNTTGVTFDLMFGTSADESIGLILGYGITNYLGVTTKTADKIIHFLPSKSLFIGSTVIAENSTDSLVLSTGISNVVYEFYLNNIYGNIVNNGNEIRSAKSITPYTLTSLDFTIKNDDGIPVAIPTEVNEDATGGIFKISVDIYSGIFDLTYYD